MVIVKQGIEVENLEHEILEPETSSETDKEEEENGMKVQGLLQSIEELYQMLEDFNVALRGRVMSIIRRKATLILQTSDQVSDSNIYSFRLVNCKKLAHFILKKTL